MKCLLYRFQMFCSTKPNFVEQNNINTLYNVYTIIYIISLLQQNYLNTKIEAQYI